jgi:hypothetical protein
MTFLITMHVVGLESALREHVPILFMNESKGSCV